jgi:hypothetical protein
VDGARSDIEGQWLVPRTQLDRDPRAVGGVVLEQMAQGQRQPMAAERVALRRLGQERGAPATELQHDGLEGLAPRRQAEQGGGDGGRRLLAGDHAGSFQLPQAARQQVRGDAGQPVLQVAVAGGPPEQQLAHDQQRPAVAHHVEGLGQGAVLLVGAHAGIIDPVMDFFK